MVFMLVFLSACQSAGDKASGEPLDTSATTTDDSVSAMEDPDPTDTIAATGYATYCSSPRTIDLIRKTLSTTLLKDDLTEIPMNERKFRFHEFDLNEDGQNEILVGFTGTYFCGTGGCNAVLLSATGVPITTFTVTEFPVMVAANRTDGWHDLIIESHGKYYDVKYQKESNAYPSNPSVQPEFKGRIASQSPALLEPAAACPSVSFN